MGMEEGQTKGTAAVEEENNGSGESLLTSSATASPHQHLIDLLYLLSLPIGYNSELRNRWPSVRHRQPLLPTRAQSDLRRIIHGISGCDIIFGRSDVFSEPSRRHSESKAGPGRREHGQPSAEVLVAKAGLHGFGTPADV